MPDKSGEVKLDPAYSSGVDPIVGYGSSLLMEIKGWGMADRLLHAEI